MIKYWEIFLDKIKLFLLYFIEFLKDNIIVSKKYLSNCAVKRSKKRSIIIITYDKNIFFIDNNYKKIWTLNGQGIFKSKGKRKRIIALNLLLS